MTKIQWRNYLVSLAMFIIFSWTLERLFPNINFFIRIVIAAAISSGFESLWKRYRSPKVIEREAEINQDERHIQLRNQAGFNTMKILLYLAAFVLVLGGSIIPESMEVPIMIAVFAGFAIFQLSYFWLERNN